MGTKDLAERLRIATRSTPLAVIQTEIVAAALRDQGYTVERVELRSLGDRSLGGNLTVRRGVFTAELDQALFEGRADLAVHSLKDLPLELDPRLVVVAIPDRSSPHDLLLCNQLHSAAPWQPLESILNEWVPASGSSTTAISPAAAFGQLADGAVVGTSSPRRQAGALAARPDLVCCAVRGSVGRRLEWLRSGAVDALILAEAGLERLSRDEQNRSLFEAIAALRLDAASWPPAPGQGALAVVALASSRWRDDPGLSELRDVETWAAVAGERSLLAEFGGGCALPLGAYCQRSSDGLATHVSVALASEGWRQAASHGAAPIVCRIEDARVAQADAVTGGDKETGATIAETTTKLSKQLRTDLCSSLERLRGEATGAGMSQASRTTGPAPELVITSSGATTSRLGSALPQTAGQELVVAEFPVTETAILEVEWPVAAAEAATREATEDGVGRRGWPWVLVCSPSAAEVIVARTAREPAWSRLPWCAFAAGTARALLGHACPPNLVANAQDAQGFARFLTQHVPAGATLVLPQSELADDQLARSLRDQGFAVHAFAAYTKNARAALSWPDHWRGPPRRLLFTSPSAVSAIADAGLAIPATCWALGKTTASAMRTQGLPVDAVATSPDPDGVARLWASANLDNAKVE